MGVDLGYHAVGESFSLNLPDIAKKVEDSDSVTEDTFIDVTNGLERSCSWLDIRNYGKL
jgi:phage tail tube protein FII